MGQVDFASERTIAHSLHAACCPVKQQVVSQKAQFDFFIPEQVKKRLVYLEIETSGKRAGRKSVGVDFLDGRVQGEDKPLVGF